MGSTLLHYGGCMHAVTVTPTPFSAIPAFATYPAIFLPECGTEPSSETVSSQAILRELGNVIGWWGNQSLVIGAVIDENRNLRHWGLAWLRFRLFAPMSVMQLYRKAGAQ
jgi:hypothetical protein